MKINKLSQFESVDNKKKIQILQDVLLSNVQSFIKPTMFKSTLGEYALKP